jgi:hypothetical protein
MENSWALAESEIKATATAAKGAMNFLDIYPPNCRAYHGL